MNNRRTAKIEGKAPEVRPLAKGEVKKDIDEFLRILDARLEEQKLQEFLAAHSYFFNRILRLNGESPLYSKVRLGDQFEVDFVCFDTGSSGPEWYLVEIECPSSNLFTKAGRTSAPLTHAMQQVRDWLTWVHENREFARNLMPHIDYPLGYIFMGRRNQLQESSRRQLKRINYENRLFFIHTLDWFADAAREVLSTFDGTRGQRRVLPTKALTHEALRRGLPPGAQGYMKGFVAMLIANGSYPKEILEDREHDRWPFGQSI
jgi:hypothetical protein